MNAQKLPSSSPLNATANLAAPFDDRDATSGSKFEPQEERMDALSAIIGVLASWSDHRRQKALEKRALIQQKRAAANPNGAGRDATMGGSWARRAIAGLAFVKRAAGIWMIASALIGAGGAMIEKNAAQMNASYDWVLLNPAHDGFSVDSAIALSDAKQNAPFWNVIGETQNKATLTLVPRANFFEQYGDAEAKCVETGACQFVSLSKTDWEKWQTSGEAPPPIAAAGWSSENPFWFFAKTNPFLSLAFILGILAVIWSSASLASAFDETRRRGGLAPAAKVLAVGSETASSVMGGLLVLATVALFINALKMADDDPRLARPAWGAMQAVMDGTLAPENAHENAHWDQGLSGNPTPEDRARLDLCLSAGFCAWEKNGVSLGGGDQNRPDSETQALLSKNPETMARQREAVRLGEEARSKSWGFAGAENAAILIFFLLLALAWAEKGLEAKAEAMAKWEGRLRKWIRRGKAVDTEKLARVVEAAKATER